MSRARLMSDSMVEQLQEAGEDVVYLTSQGYSPTDAVAKVASAAKFTKDQTKLLIHSYAAGIAAEKRASAGGPFERLAEYELPDPDKVIEIVFGSKTKPESKEASLTPNVPIFDMRHLDRDLSKMSSTEINQLFHPETKCAESDCESALESQRKPGSGVSITRISVSVSAPGAKRKEEEPEDDQFVHSIPETLEDQLKAGLKMMSPELSKTIDSLLKDMIKQTGEEKTSAYADADIAYAQLGGMVERFGRRMSRLTDSIDYKAAGLASVNAFYPDVSELLTPYLGEVLRYRLKTAGYSALDISRSHAFVAEAKAIHDQIEKTADLTLKANHLKEYYDSIVDLYKTRPRGEPADWAKFALFGSEKVTKPVINTAKSTVTRYGDLFKDPVLTGDAFTPMYSENQQALRKDNSEEVQRQLGDLSSLSSLMRLKNIETMSMLNDFSVNDDILSAYPMHELVGAYNDLSKTVPHLMRDKPLSRSLLQQYMAQGRFALTELEPAIKMDEALTRRYGALIGEGRTTKSSAAETDEEEKRRPNDPATLVDVGGTAAAGASVGAPAGAAVGAGAGAGLGKIVNGLTYLGDRKNLNKTLLGLLERDTSKARTPKGTSTARIQPVFSRIGAHADVAKKIRQAMLSNTIDQDTLAKARKLFVAGKSDTLADLLDGHLSGPRGVPGGSEIKPMLSNLLGDSKRVLGDANKIRWQNFARKGGVTGAGIGLGLGAIGAAIPAASSWIHDLLTRKTPVTTGEK